MTDTAKIANVVLPAAAWAEKEVSVSSPDRLVKWRFKEVETPEMAKPDYEILFEISKVAGYNFSSDSIELFEEIKKVSPLYLLNINNVMDYTKD